MNPAQGMNMSREACWEGGEYRCVPLCEPLDRAAEPEPHCWQQPLGGQSHGSRLYICLSQLEAPDQSDHHTFTLDLIQRCLISSEGSST